MLRANAVLAVASAAWLAAGAPARAQELDPATRARVDRIFAPWDRPGSPGCALGIVREGKLVYARGYGTANLETGEPITPRTVFYAASVSKQFTAAAIALLAQEGRLSLDDDVRRYVPELPDYGHRVTLRHLIHHTSGIRDYLTLMPLAGMNYDRVYTDAEILDLIARQTELNFEPGTRYLYSNSGYFLLALVAGRVTGSSLRAVADEKIFRRLGMSDSHFHDDHTHRVERRALAYAPDSAGGYRLEFYANFDKVGSGGLLTTVEDLARWDRNFRDPKVGGDEFVRRILTPGVLANGDTLDYAFALVRGTYKGLTTWRHGGSFMGFRTHYLRVPDAELGVICLCNLATIEPGRLAERVVDVVLEDAVRSYLAAYAGSYAGEDLGVTYRVDLHGADLVVHGAGERDWTLEDRGGDRFGVRDAPGLELEFVRAEDGRIAGFRLDAGRALGLRFVRADVR